MAIICAQCGHRNPDGSRFCANPECGAFLAWTAPDGGPQATPPPPEPSRPRPLQGDATRWGYSDDGHSDVAASMALTDATLAVQPGDTASTTISVHNGGNQVEQFAVTVLGPTAPWAEIDPPVLVVYPDVRAEAVVRWSPPRAPTTMAGHAPFTIRAASALHRGLQVHANGVLQVGEFREVTATLTPQTTAGRWQTTHRVEVTNAGNVVEPVQVKATDPAGRIKFSLPAGEVMVPPGSQSMDLTVRPPMRFFGKQVSQPFQVLASPRQPLPPARLDGTREIVPLIAGWIPKVIAGLAAVAIVAALALFTQPWKKDPGETAGPGGAAAATATIPPSLLPGNAGKASPAGDKKGGGSASVAPSASAADELKTPWAVVNDTANLVTGVGVTAVVARAPGRIEVAFARNVSNCVSVAMIAASGGKPMPDRGLVFTATGSTPAAVVVETREIDGTLRSYPFHLQVRCSSGDTAVVLGDRALRGTDQPNVRQTEDGLWEIRFNRGIRKCAYVATIGDPGAGNPGTGLIAVGNGQQNPAALLVETRARDGNRTDLPFHVMTRCSGLFAVVGADGRPDRANSVTDVRHPGDGTYEIDFDKDVSACSYVAAIGSVDGTIVENGGEVYAASGPQPATVLINTRRLDPATGEGQLADFPFHLHVVC